jgi:hypothetical protein
MVGGLEGDCPASFCREMTRSHVTCLLKRPGGGVGMQVE